MEKNILPGLRWTFWAHVVVGLIFGLGMLLIPDTMMGVFGVTVTAEGAALYRLVGAAVLAFTTTSWFAVHETEWAHVKIIVEGEIVWTVLGAIAYAYGIITMGYPPITWISALIMAAFAIAFGYFYIQEGAVKMATAVKH